MTNEQIQFPSPHGDKLQSDKGAQGCKSIVVFVPLRG